MSVSSLGVTRSKSTTIETTGTARSSNSVDLAINKYNFGYSMAFKSIPFAMSFSGEYTQFNAVSFGENETIATTARSTFYYESQHKVLGLGISRSGHNKFDDYMLGYNLCLRSDPDLWLSAIGLFYYTSKLNQDDNFAMGLTFGSEFSY